MTEKKVSHMFQNQFETKLNLRKISLDATANPFKMYTYFGTAIGQNLLDNKISVKTLNINCFLILATGQSFFHLAMLKANLTK